MAQVILSAGYRKIVFIVTKMPLDHRARKRFEVFSEKLLQSGIEIADKEFYSGSSALAKGRDMTTDMLMRSPDLDFLYFSNDMIGAGGLLYLLNQKADIPQKIGLAGFNGVELLQGLPLQLATMDACRLQIGRQAAQIICDRISGAPTLADKIAELTPKLPPGATLRSAQPWRKHITFYPTL